MQQQAGLLKRIKLALKQPTDTVVFRTANGVWEHKLDINILALPEYKPLQQIPELAALAALAYHDTDSASEFLSRSQQQVPVGWQLISGGADIRHLNTRGKVLNGLKYDVWYCASTCQLVISFRGSGKRLGDWFSNFRWFTRIIPGVQDHYDVVQANIAQILHRARSACGEVKGIATTGHSLGGGLAQHAAYSSEQITSVYAFNPTPITGFYSIAEAQRRSSAQDLFIARVFEHGEVLAYLRFGLRHFYKISAANPEIVEVRFNFLKKTGIVYEHSMQRLAHQISKLSSQPQFAKTPGFEQTIQAGG